jgi:hypothetical protein
LPADLVVGLRLLVSSVDDHVGGAPRGADRSALDRLDDKSVPPDAAVWFGR